MATVLGIGFWLLGLALAPFFLLMAMVTIAAFLSRTRPAGPSGDGASKPPKLLVVIPAHNEEANVAATVASCLASRYDRARFEVWVIADNCDDATARAARGAGAKVFERVDATRRSKGYALEDFFKSLSDPKPGQGGAARGPLGDEFVAAVVIDADSVVDPTLLASIAQALDEGDDWVQCYYTVRNPDASWRTRLLTYAFSLFNGVWLLGQDELGLGAGFRGNGMAFSARGLGRVPWKAYGLVEDQEFSWMLRVAGERVAFLPGARVYGEMVSRGRGALTQRQRWEQGRRSLRARFVGAVLKTNRLSPLHKGLALLDLFMPPMMPLLAGFVILTAALPLGWLMRGLDSVILPLTPLIAFMALTFFFYTISPFLLLRLPPRYLASLCMIPYFLFWKLFATFRARASGWVRTEREGHEPSNP